MIPGARLLSSPSHYAIAKELVASENAIGTRLLMFSSRWVNVPSMACPALLALLAAIRSLLWSRAQVHAEALAIRHLSPRPSGRSLRGDRTDGVKMGGASSIPGPVTTQSTRRGGAPGWSCLKYHLIKYYLKAPVDAETSLGSAQPGAGACREHPSF